MYVSFMSFPFEKHCDNVKKYFSTYKRDPQQFRIRPPLVFRLEKTLQRSLSGSNSNEEPGHCQALAEMPVLRIEGTLGTPSRTVPPPGSEPMLDVRLPMKIHENSIPHLIYSQKELRNSI